MTTTDRAEYDAYMGAGIAELRRLWFDGPYEPGSAVACTEAENPPSTLGFVMDIGLLGGLAVGAYAFGPQLWVKLTQLHTAAAATTGAGLPPVGTTATTSLPGGISPAQVTSWAQSLGINNACATQYVLANGGFPSGSNGLATLTSWKNAQGSKYSCNLP